MPPAKFRRNNTKGVEPAAIRTIRSNGRNLPVWRPAPPEWVLRWTSPISHNDGVKPKDWRNARLKWDKSVKPASAAMSAICDAPTAPPQHPRRLYQPALQEVMGKAPAGLFEQQTNVARCDSEQSRNCDRTQTGIAASVLDGTEDGGATGGAKHAVLSRVRHTAFIAGSTTRKQFDGTRLRRRHIADKKP